jgi:hypothetical protein
VRGDLVRLGRDLEERVRAIEAALRRRRVGDEFPIVRAHDFLSLAAVVLALVEHTAGGLADE